MTNPRRQFALDRLPDDVGDLRASLRSRQVVRLLKAYDERPTWALDVRGRRVQSSIVIEYKYSDMIWLNNSKAERKFILPALECGRLRHVEYVDSEIIFKCEHGTQWVNQRDVVRSMMNRKRSSQYIGICAKCRKKYVKIGGCGTYEDRVAAYKDGRLDPNRDSALYVLSVNNPSDVGLNSPVMFYGISVQVKTRIEQHSYEIPNGFEVVKIMKGPDWWVNEVENYLKENITKNLKGRRPTYKSTEYVNHAAYRDFDQHLAAAIKYANSLK